jgi:hypothetical protein
MVPWLGFMDTLKLYITFQGAPRRYQNGNDLKISVLRFSWVGIQKREIDRYGRYYGKIVCLGGEL